MRFECVNDREGIKVHTYIGCSYQNYLNIVISDKNKARSKRLHYQQKVQIASKFFKIVTSIHRKIYFYRTQLLIPDKIILVRNQCPTIPKNTIASLIDQCTVLSAWFFAIQRKKYICQSVHRNRRIFISREINYFASRGRIIN